ncbi:hypothetical protein H3H45_00230 [Pseudomonas sp. SR9]|uniref:3-isopropylmalate dehydratase large subunit n=1 Tax=Aquipseudomonas guryensis TaxID=2759165 RepID=A0A7W4H1M4_9GAMM|nr:hypothetical protein [Pseudomonas guryensis]MBB1517643.1 hypothetical protein [Pseudomonas guryensis]
MRPLFVLFAALLCGAPLSAAELSPPPAYYGVLIVSRDRLEVATTCDIGIYLQDKLAARIYQGQSASFNLPPGTVAIRLGYMGGLGCEPSFEQIRSTRVQIEAGAVQQYRIALDLGSLTLLQVQP